MNESEDTDKKLFLKVIGQVDDVEELERVINVPMPLSSNSSAKRANLEKKSEFRTTRPPFSSPRPKSQTVCSRTSRVARSASMR
jgi:hypothetical protein